MDCPFHTSLSPKYGRGLFSTIYFSEGSVLFKVADLNRKFTWLGRHMNRSKDGFYNVKIVRGNDGWYAIALTPIYAGREIVSNLPVCEDFAPSDFYYAPLEL